MNSTPPMAFFSTSRGLGRGMADVLADQIVARHRDQMPFAHIAETVQQPGHFQRHRGLADAGIAGETHVQRRRLVREAELLARALHQQQRGGLADALLDRREADQLVVELAQDVRDAELAKILGEIDLFRRFRENVGFGHGRSPNSGAGQG